MDLLYIAQLWSFDWNSLSLRALEPVLILLAGLWVAFFVYAMYRPLFMVSPLMR